MPDAAPTFDSGVADAMPPAPCNPVTQDGCTAAQKCSIVPSSIEPPMFGCVDNVGSALVLESCTPATPGVPDNCAKGLTCRGDDDPRCLAFCTDTPADTCGAGEVCLFEEDLDGDLIADVSYCAITCDVLDQDCGIAGTACYPSRDADVCAPIGAGGVPSQQGESCDYANSCDSGLGCFRVGTSTQWLCFAICDVFGSGGPACAGNQICNRHESDDWGICIDL